MSHATTREPWGLRPTTRESRRDRPQETIQLPSTALRCVHGHADATGSRCVCNYGYEGLRCDQDILIACAKVREWTERAGRPALAPAPCSVGQRCSMSAYDFRYRLQRMPWTCDLLVMLPPAAVSGDSACECLEACSAYLWEQSLNWHMPLRPILLDASVLSPCQGRAPHLEATFSPAPVVLVRRKHQSLPVATMERSWDTLDAQRSSLSEARVLLHARNTPLFDIQFTVSSLACWTDCLGRGECRGHFCEHCAVGSATPACGTARHSLRQGRERQQPKTNGPGELSLALLDLPGVVLHEHGFERYRKPRGDFNVPALLVKRQTYWAQGYFYAGLLWHGAELLSSANGSRILVAVTATRLSPDCVRLAAQTAGMGSNASWSWTLLLDFLPTDMPRFRPAPGTVRFHNHCTPGVGFSAASDVCLPACSEAYMMPFEDFNRHGGMDPDTASIAHYYNASRKDALFFFAGSSGADVHNCTSSLGRMVFDQSRGGRCASCYSLCMRQYFHRHFLHHPQMRFSDRGGWQSRSRFCLVAGGAGFDSRMLSSVQLGCIPLWTNRLALPPLFRVLRLETFMISFSDSAADRQRFVKMADLPAFLGCYAPAYATLLANLARVAPAFVWGNGSAFEHALLEIATVTGTRASGAMRRMLRLHGEAYVAEVLRVDLDGYSEGHVPGIGKARALRERQRRHDPIPGLLASVDRCIRSIDLRGVPAA